MLPTIIIDFVSSGYAYASIEPLDAFSLFRMGLCMSSYYIIFSGLSRLRLDTRVGCVYYWYHTFASNRRVKVTIGPVLWCSLVFDTAGYRHRTTRKWQGQFFVGEDVPAHRAAPWKRPLFLKKKYKTIKPLLRSCRFLRRLWIYVSDIGNWKNN